MFRGVSFVLRDGWPRNLDCLRMFKVFQRVTFCLFWFTKRAFGQCFFNMLFLQEKTIGVWRGVDLVALGRFSIGASSDPTRSRGTRNH